MAVVELYVKALDVPTDYSEQEPWSTYFRLAAANIAFGDGTGPPSSGGVGGGGLWGASLAPDENVAASHPPGGQPALEPQEERSRTDRRKQREATKHRRAAAVQELQQLRAWKQARVHTGGSAVSSPSKSQARVSTTRRASRTCTRNTCDGKECYDSGDDKPFMGADVAPGKPCSSGRADVMRIFVEYDRFVLAVYLWNAREVEARVFLRREVSLTNLYLYSHVQSTNELAPEALSLPERSNSSADSPMFTTSASLTEISNSGISRCRHGARSRSQTSVGMSGSGRAQRLWQEHHGRPGLPSGRKKGRRQSLWSFGPRAVRSSSPLWKPLRREGFGTGPDRFVSDVSGGSHCGGSRTFSAVHRRGTATCPSW